MEFAIKVKCEGYVVVIVDAKNKDEALQMVEEASFYVANDSIGNAPAETADSEIIWCKEKQVYEYEHEIDYERKYGHFHQLT